MTWVGRALRLGAQVPEPVLRGLFRLATSIMSASKIAGYRQLERNLSQLTGIRDPKWLAKATREGLTNYGHYWVEAIRLGSMNGLQIDARVELQAPDAFLRDARSSSVVVAVSHSGNWDLAAAWVARNIRPVLTVAERLNDPDDFTAFMALRQGLGLSIISGVPGSHPYHELKKRAGTEQYVVALAADRDITGRGVEVAFGSEQALVGAGPAALSIDLGIPLYCATLRHEILSKSKRRLAGSKWGVVIEIAGPYSVNIASSDDSNKTLLKDRGGQIRQLTRTWAQDMANATLRYPTHWHMLQKVFIQDLDAQRLARARARSLQE